MDSLARFFLFLSTLILKHQISQVNACDFNTISTKFGKIHGKSHTTFYGRNICAFTGVPYADPPVGENRFKPPQPIKPWSRILNATTDPPLCAQIKDGEVIGDEDCLYLNIYTPKVPAGKSPYQLYPVLFYIYGGLWEVGGANEPVIDPDFLLDNDVVLVTLNYRTGSLGFLSTGDVVIPGNWGLKDMVFALKWVHENIVSFGGDNKAVTLLGNSKGAAAIHILLYFEPVKGLFKGGISLEGVSNNPGSIFPLANITIPSQKLAKVVGCPSEPSHALLRCIQTKPFREIVKHQDQVRFNPIVPPRVITQWGPVRESPDAEQAILYFDLENPSFKPEYPWIVSVDLFSGSSYVSRIFGQANLTVALREDPHQILPLLLQLSLQFCQKDIPAITDRIIGYFFGNRPVGRETEAELAKLFTCRFYFVGARHASLRYPGPLWFFNNIYNQSVSYNEIAPGNVTEGPTDPDITFSYTRATEDFPVRPFSKNDLINIKRVTDMIYSFALYGNPTVGNSIRWDRARQPWQLNYLRVGKTFTQECDFYPSCVKFFDSLATEYPSRTLYGSQNC